MKWVEALTTKLGLSESPRLRKMVVGLIGGTIVLLGMALLVLPGPASIVIPVGLVILASEFAWARWLVRSGRLAIDKTGLGKLRKVFSSKPQP
jgi:tellurite resistance protein TerC